MAVGARNRIDQDKRGGPLLDQLVEIQHLCGIRHVKNTTTGLALAASAAFRTNHLY